MSFVINKTAISIAVLMTVHNRKDMTLECLKRLFSNKIEDCELTVFLVDDGCIDGTTEAIRSKYNNVTIISGDGNLYWNQGMLLAWKKAAESHPDFFLWLNDDTMLYPEALQIMMNAYSKAETEDVIICGSTNSKNNRRYTTYGGRINSKLLNPNGHLQTVKWINGNFVLVPKSVANKIGMLDPYFHHARGDWEYGCRAKKNGVSLYIAPTYIGTCELHSPQIQKCYDPSIPLKKRMEFLSHPLGPNPKETFYFCRNCLPWGIPRALLYISKMYFRTLMPYFFL